MKSCKSCHHENEEAALFCENCGEQLEIAQNDTLETEVNPKTVDQNSCSCGAQLGEEDRFCPTCGKAITQESKTKAENSQTSNVKTPMNKKQKILISLAIVFLCIIFGSYFAAKNYYSQENQLKRMVAVVKNKDISQMEKLTVSADPNYNVTKEELKKYFDYYGRNEHKAAFSTLITQLSDNTDQTRALALTKKGKKFLMFDEYLWELKPSYITITANQKGMILFLDNQEKETTDKQQFQTVWGPLTPAEYTIKGELAGEKSETTVDLVQSQNSGTDQMSEVSLDFRKISFKLRSNISDAEVFLNDKKVGVLSAGEYEVKDKIWQQGMTVQLKKTLEDKSVIMTKQQVIDDSSFEASRYDPKFSIVNSDFSGIQEKSDVEFFLNGFYSDVSNFTGTYATYDETTKQKFSSYFREGKDNAEYQDFDTFIQSVRDSKIKSSVNGSPTVESVKMIGKNTYDVRYLIKYKTIYKDYKQKDVTQIFRYQKATLVYNEEEKKFTIQSLGGKENFEVVDNGGIE